MLKFEFPETENDIIRRNMFIAENDIRTLHFIEDGVTVIVRPISNKFIDVSIAYCNPTDQYTKKIGRNLAIRRMMNGNYITLRVPRYVSNNNFQHIKSWIDAELSGVIIRE